MMKILVSGHVQGVCFRQKTKELADSLQLKGSVRNLPDGRVEIFLDAEKKPCEIFITTLKNEADTYHISDVNFSLVTEPLFFDSFKILH